MKCKENKKKRGFTLVELLVAIGIVGIILTISTVSVYTIIKNSKENSNEIVIDNLKKSAEVYAKEYNKEIIWDDDNTTCISIQTLISKGYIKKNSFDKEKAPLSIILTRDEYNVIISEYEEYLDCDTYSKTVEIPTNKDVCNNFTYDGFNHFLINKAISMNNYSNIEYLDATYANTNNLSEHPKNAGEYKVAVNLKKGKQWTDSTKEQKIVTCKINKATPTLELSSMGNSDTKENIGTKEISLKANVDGIVSIKSSNNKYVTAKLKDDNNITAGINKFIEITTVATRNSTTTVTITVTPTGEYKNNYKEATITYIVGNIKNTIIEKPTSSLCNNFSYNGNTQALAKSNEAYQLINNSAIEIGTYTVTAILKYGYIWNDNTTYNVEFNCDIKIPTPRVTYKDAVCSPIFINVTYNKPYGENQSLCIPTKTGYTFNDWYSNNSYVNKITNNTIVENFNNHNLYAKWTAHTYNINYDCNGGEGLTTSSYHVYDIEKRLTNNSCIKTGYTFKGWNTNSDGSGTGYTNNQSVKNLTSENNKTITLYAMWTPNTYTVTFDANGGTVDPLTTLVTYDSVYGSLPKPKKSGYEFTGWYTEKNGGTQLTKDTIVKINENQILYAHWKVLFISQSFTYTGKIQSFTVPVSGTYKLEVWGAQGGSINGGLGGYSSGNLYLTEGNILYIVIGNKPTTYSGIGGYNGGGNGGDSGSDRGGGGGATHIGKTSTLLKSTALQNLYIVAGGGGGGTNREGEYKTSAQGGTGGGASGGTGGNSGACVGTGADCFERFAAGGTQTSGGLGGIGRDFYYNVYVGNNGSYGQGGHGDAWRAGGGGGYYGGGAAGVSAFYTSGAGGGSGYVGGVNNGYMENGKNSGNGKAIITLIQ